MTAVSDLTPRRIVAELDRWIVGQTAAKRAVAVALRNRWRRQRLPEAEREEIRPKNLILVGPTGVGKTEIARRLASLVDAPFLKVEVTKYSEVGYVGRDVESIARDLVDVAVERARSAFAREVQAEAASATEERLLDVLVTTERDPSSPFAEESPAATRSSWRERLRGGTLEGHLVEIRVEDRVAPSLQVFSGSGTEVFGFDAGWSSLLRSGSPPRTRLARVPLSEARRHFEREECEKRIDRDAVIRDALARTEESGIVFLDEIDKIVGSSREAGPDVSREGVQRDLLPLVEGTTVATRYGPVRTDHVLFLAAGAFSKTRPSDLIPEIQGRFPVSVRLESLGRDEFVRILTEPENAPTKQVRALARTEGVDLSFSPDGIAEIAALADRLNVARGDIGARRLHSVLERLLEGLFFDAPDAAPPAVLVDRDYVREFGRTLYEEADLAGVR
jgi:ATP-dependent HslUV protease ATP-binding subunit HslU